MGRSPRTSTPAALVPVWGLSLGFRIWGFGLGVAGSGFRAWDLGFGVSGLGIRVKGVGFVV